MDGSLEPLPVALWEHPPPFVFSVPVQTLGIGVVFAIATVMTVNLTFTAPYHYPLSKCNYILQLTAAFLFLITVATSLSIMVHTLATRAAQEPHLFPYLPETLPSRDWTLAQQVLFLLMQAVSVSMANVRVALTQFTHIQFLTLLFPSKLEMRLIVWLMSPVVLAQFGLFFMFYVEDVGAEIQDICECTLSLLYTAALVIWGTLINRQRAWRRDGATALFASIDGRPGGVIAVADPVKASTPEALARLREDGIRIVMLTGDNRTTAEAVARTLGIPDIEAEVLPEDKNRVVKRLKAQGRIVAMAGDGVNDAPALAEADVGVAMGTGTDVAIRSAGVTLVKGDLAGIARARTLSRATMSNIRQNLVLAFVYNALGVPVAAGLFYPLFGWTLSPIIAAAAMALSSVSVIGNALRLRTLRL